MVNIKHGIYSDPCWSLYHSCFKYSIVASYLLAFFLGIVIEGKLLIGNLDILENGHSYEQSITYDPQDSTMTISVPAHNDIDASTLIIHHPTVSLNIFEVT